MAGTNYTLSGDSYFRIQSGLNYTLSLQEQCPHSGPRHTVQGTGPATIGRDTHTHTHTHTHCIDLYQFLGALPRSITLTLTMT